LSSLPNLEPTAEATGLAEAYAIAKAKVSLCKTLALEIKAKLSAAIEAGEDVKGAAKTKTVKPAPKFSVTKLKSDHKELYEKYCIKTYAIAETFKVLVEPPDRDKLDREFLDEFESIEIAVVEITDLSDAYLLNLSQLALTRLESLSQWDMDLAEAELQNLCGEHEGIDGVCSWVRKESSTSKFDVDTFANENLELWLEYTLPRDEYTRLLVNKKKS
jgi:hypothetical protein